MDNQKTQSLDNHKIIKHRKLIQFLSMLIYNADVKNWFTGNISRSALKNVCVPGLNCYSCPGAISSCPLGAIQNTLASGKAPILITGLLLLFGTLFGRAICAFLCPVGFIQELIYKIPSPKIPKTKKNRNSFAKTSKNKIHRFNSYAHSSITFLFYKRFCVPIFLSVPLSCRNCRSWLALSFTSKRTFRFNRIFIQMENCNRNFIYYLVSF